MQILIVLIQPRLQGCTIFRSIASLSAMVEQRILRKKTLEKFHNIHKSYDYLVVVTKFG